MICAGRLWLARTWMVEINLGKAAELLEMHRLELQERFIAQSIPVRLGPDTVEEARAELTAIESWNAEAEKETSP